jgi:hypothetical protein
MGFRLFRRIRIAPGLSVNLSKGGLSLSGGVRGARITVGRRGVRRTVGLPGSGVSYTETSGGGDDVATGSQEQGGGGIGCVTSLFILLAVILAVQQCSPSSGGWRQSTDPSTEPTLIASPTPDTGVPLALAVAPLAVVKRGADVHLEISAAYGSACEVGVPLIGRTGDAPQPVEMPERGTVTLSWLAGAKAASTVVTVVCTLGDQREALEILLVVR